MTSGPGIATRADLLPGRYMCLRTSGIVPWAIREATGSDYDHTAVIIPGGQVVEAEPGDIRITPLSYYDGAQAVVCTDRMTAGQATRVCGTARSLVGADYNFATIGYQALADLAGWHWALLLHLAEHGHVFDCSQLAAVAGRAAGLDWMCGQSDPALVTPAELARRPGVVPVAWV